MVVRVEFTNFDGIVHYYVLIWKLYNEHEIFYNRFEFGAVFSNLAPSGN